MRLLFFLLLLSTPQLVTAQFGPTIRTARPGFTTGANAVGAQVFQIQAGFLYRQREEEGGTMHVQKQLTTIRLGIAERLELSGVIHWETDHCATTTGLEHLAHGISQTQIGGRVNLLQNRGWIPTIGLQGRLLLKAQNEDYRRDHVGTNFVLATSNRINDQWSFGTNLGLRHAAEGNGTEWRYALKLGLHLHPRVSTLAEMFGDLSTRTTHYNIGLGYLLHPDLQIDCSAGWEGQTEQDHWFVHLGLSWRLVWRS